MGYYVFDEKYLLLALTSTLYEVTIIQIII